MQQLARSHWISHVKANRQNLPVLGTGNDLEDFFFLSSRQSLAILGQGLRKLDGSSCFMGATLLVVANGLRLMKPVVDPAERIKRPAEGRTVRAA